MMKSANGVGIDGNVNWRRPRNGGFTLIELLVVIAIIGILASLLLPVLSAAKKKAQGAQCMSNTKQIVLAWIMYSSDNNDLFAPNDFYSGGPPGSPPPKAWYGVQRQQLNWVGGGMDFNPANPENTNYLDLVGDPGDALGNYNPNAQVYHCPADKSVVPGLGPRVRSVSMNGAVGTIWNTATVPPLNGCMKGAPVGGTWLSSSWNGACINSSGYQSYGKMSSMVRPGPSLTWVIMDENPQSINDPVMCVQMANQSKFIDSPATYHNNAAGISYADGHSEIHRWSGQALLNAVSGVAPTVRTSGDLNDLLYLQQRTSAPQ